MRNVSVNMIVDRHRHSGNARIHGTVDNKPLDVVVRKGPQEGDFYLQGEINRQPTTLRINSGLAEDGHAVFGRLAGVPMRGLWKQDDKEGDATLQINSATLSLDVKPNNAATEARAPGLRLSGEKTGADGDEEFKLQGQGFFSQMKVDRREDGDIQITGRSSGGPFRLEMDRRGLDGDLWVRGNLPENMGLMPLAWELYGDDNLEPVGKPLGMASAASLSAFWSHLTQ